jgi:LemA protein
MSYNILRESFPNNIIAGMFSFQPAQLLDIEDPAKREAVQVNFG